MTKRRRLYISLFFLAVLSVLMPGRQQAGGGDPHQDFWWDYGETDEKHATFAPALEKEITRKTGVEVIAIEKRKVFVADEYLQIRFLILVPFDVRIDEKRLPQELPPFEIIGFRFGRRHALGNERDMEQQELLITLRLDPSYPYDTYMLPSFALHYEYDTIAGNSRTPQKETAATDDIVLEKVPVYARVIQQRNTGFLWDTFPCLLEIHGDNSVNFLNLDPDSEADVLRQFKPVYPFVLRDQKRSEFTGDHYRVIRHEFMLAIQDFRNQPYTLTFPRIIWQQDGASPAGENVITPDSPVFFLRRITGDASRLAALKKNIPAPPGERYRLLDVPLQILWALMALGLFRFAFLYRQRHKQLKNDRIPPVGKPGRSAGDTWPWQAVILDYLVFRARRGFQKKPCPGSCMYLRELLARRAAVRLPGRNRLTPAEVCALTAGELADLGAGKEDIAALRQLDRQLESGRYDTLRAVSQEIGK